MLEELLWVRVMEEVKTEEKKWCVYIHTNKINNKAYIGITSRRLSERWGNNGRGYRKEQPIFHRAIKKYGWDNFEHVIWADELSEEGANIVSLRFILVPDNFIFFELSKKNSYTLYLIL